MGYGCERGRLKACITYLRPIKWKHIFEQVFAMRKQMWYNGGKQSLSDKDAGLIRPALGVCEIPDLSLLQEYKQYGKTIYQDKRR